MKVAVVYNNQACSQERLNGSDFVLHSMPLFKTILYPLTQKAANITESLPRGLGDKLTLFPEISCSFILPLQEVINLLRERISNLEIKEIIGQSGQLPLPI